MDRWEPQRAVQCQRAECTYLAEGSLEIEIVAAGEARFGLVFQLTSRAAALRVPNGVREALRIGVYVVSEDGRVEVVDLR